MTANPLISVIMSTYNESIEWIDKAVQSILIQTYKEIEFIVIVDNPQREDVIEYLNNIEDDRLSVHVNETNKGLVYSLNRAIGLASGDYIARMDADDISEEKRLEIEIRYLSDNNLDMVGSFVTRFTDYEKNVGEYKCPEDDKRIKKSIRHLRGIPHPTWLGKKEVFVELDGYRSIDRAEDYDFLIRCSIEGYKLGCVQMSLVKYRLNGSGQSRSSYGAQQYVTLLLNRQMREKKVYDIECINSKLNQAHEEIDLFDKYFKYKAEIGKMLFRKERFKRTLISEFDIRYLKIFIITKLARIG